MDDGTTLKANLLEVLGGFPPRRPVKYETLDTVRLDNGLRYYIEYIAESGDPLFGLPEDRIRAYLFVPDHEQGEQLPAMVALHQHGRMELHHLGKLETAGLDGEDDQHYGLELFQRGYVVICQDQYTHGERRRIHTPIITEAENWADLFAQEQRNAQLILRGRTPTGKIVYDLMCAVDVLCSLERVDSSRIGAIGHSGGGLYLPYFMFADERVCVGVSSCGFNELLEIYHAREEPNLLSCMALPGLANVGRGADYLAFLAPRPFLLTRGMWEYGAQNDNARKMSQNHVAETRRIEEHARKRYDHLNAGENLVALYFDENSGYHSFPEGVKQQVYQWLDSHLRTCTDS